MAKTVFDVLIEKIDEVAVSAGDHLVSGAPKEYADYREVVGLVRGLNLSKQLIPELAKNYVEGDDD